VIPLIKSYISLQNYDAIPSLEIGSGDCGPVWAVIYYSMRCGKYREASEYMKDVVGNVEFASILEAFDPSDSSCLPFDLESKLRLEYRRVLKHSSRDVYKR